MSGPHDKGRSYICDAVLGNKQPYSNVKAHAADISKPQSGSGNWPIQIAVGAAINRDSSGQDLGPFLRGENGWGLNGTEHGSSIYEGWNVASIVALIHKAADYKKKGKKRDDARRWIKAEIAKYCLSMADGWPSRSVLHVEGEGDHKPTPIGKNGLAKEGKDGWSYPADKEYKTRYYAVMPGSRQIERFNRHDASRQQEFTVFVDRNQVTPLVAWALGFSRKFTKAPARSRDGTAWCVWLVEQATGRRYEDAAEPATFGLTDEDVKTFRRFLSDRADPSPILSYLEGYGSCKKQECHWIQLENGDVVAWNDKTIHSSTTGCVLAWTKGDKVFWASPQSTLRTSGSAQCRRQGDTLIVSASGSKLKKSPVERKFEIYKEADVLWEVVWTSEGFQIVGLAPADDGGDDSGKANGQAEPGGQSGDQVQPLPQKTSTPATGAVATAIDLAKSIPGLAEIPQPGSEPAKTALKRIRNRANEIVRLLGLGSADGRASAIGHAKSMPELAAVPKPRSEPAKTALKRIRNRANEIVRLLRT